jgi:hypothetical protein
LTIEYKAPYKLTLGYIYEGLSEIDLDKVIQVDNDKSLAICYQRLVAAVITQGYLYIVGARVEYREIYTREATIFLHVPSNPSIVYYALLVLKGDISPTTDQTKDSNQPNCLYLTAVSQAVAFTLCALQTPLCNTN